MNSIILPILGAIIIFIGIGTLINPNLSRWINLPGEPHLKALVSIIVGIILVILYFVL
jgi:hypothetical protein